MAAGRKAGDARLRYLQDASEALQISSPAIASRLGALGNRATAGSRQSTADKLDCASCGTRLVRGWSCTVAKDGKTKQTRKNRLALSGIAIKSVALKCSRCGVITSCEMKKQTRSGRLPARSTLPTPTKVADPAITQPRPTSAETRAKESATIPQKRARGKKSSLQSIIAGQKPVPSKQTSGFGLDLQDFMKP